MPTYDNNKYCGGVGGHRTPSLNTPHTSAGVIAEVVHCQGLTRLLLGADGVAKNQATRLGKGGTDPSSGGGGGGEGLENTKHLCAPPKSAIRQLHTQNRASLS
jgi:hypothetical protein